MIPRIFTPPKTSFFLFGPRGTGKTTWIRNCFPDAAWINFLRTDQVRRFSARPEFLSEWLAMQKNTKTIVIDEIQKVPELLSVVHDEIESKKGFHFILTGSSARKIKRANVDLLGGRALLKTLHPFMAHELGKEFNLPSALTKGLLPVVLYAENPDETLMSYVDLYIREEVQMEGLVRNIGNFSRFLEALSFSHGNVINVSETARECEVERKVVSNYIQIVEDLLLGFRLPVFSKRAKRKTITHEKFYFFDAGVYRSLRPSGPLDRPEEIDGAALEGLVAQHLRAWNAYRGEKNRLCYWRTYQQAEVDFVIYGPDGFCAIEAKNTARLRPADYSGLKSFKNEYPECQAAILLYRGKQAFKTQEISCIPCEDFLRQLTSSRDLNPRYF